MILQAGLELWGEQRDVDEQDYRQLCLVCLLGKERALLCGDLTCSSTEMFTDRR